jgi:hypothetical protein
MVCADCVHAELADVLFAEIETFRADVAFFRLPVNTWTVFWLF